MKHLFGHRSRSAVSAVLAVLLSTAATWSAAAPVSFTYTGRAMNTLSGTHFTAADFITGTVTLNITPGVAGSSAASIWSLTSTMSGTTAPAASFSMNNSTAGLVSNRNTFAWDATGKIVGWFIDFEADVIGGAGADGLRTCGGTSCTVAFADIAKVNGNGIFARNTNPGFIGVWVTQPVAVPEPTSLALAALGLLGAGVLRRRR